MNRSRIHPVVSRCKNSLHVPEGTVYCSHPRIAAAMSEVHHWCHQCGNYRCGVTTAGEPGVCSNFPHQDPRLRGTAALHDRSYWLLWRHWNISTNTSMDRNSTCITTTTPWTGSLVSRTCDDRQHTESSVSKIQFYIWTSLRGEAHQWRCTL
jgi:hypothetical protein